MQNCCPSFTLSQCMFKVERNRETTARITVWRCYGIKKSYTLETSYCGCDEGLYKVIWRDVFSIANIWYPCRVETARAMLSFGRLRIHLNYSFQGYHLGVKQLKEIGSTFCMSLSSLEEETQKRARLPAANRLSTERYVFHFKWLLNSRHCMCMISYNIRY